MIIEKNFIVPFWNDHIGLKVGFTLPVMGNQALTRKSITSNNTTKENRINLAKKLGIKPDNIFSPHQIHSDIIINVSYDMKGKGAYSKRNAIKGDACITKNKNILLIVTWADCVPVLLYDKETKWLAAIHSGWKSVKQNIIKNTINVLRNNEVSLKNVFAAIGPGIKDCCYNVGKEFNEYFKKSKFLINKNNGLYFNLSGYVYEELLKIGINKNNIDFFNICTCCNENPSFFSCRKDGINFEAQAAFIGIFDRNTLDFL